MTITPNHIMAVIIPLLTYLLFRYSLRSVMLYLNRKNDIELCQIKYEEETIINHLDFLINESLEKYILLELTPKQPDYINSKMESMIVDTIKDEVSDQISPTLYKQLSMIYNYDYIPKLIGTRIYMAVLNYTISFNDPRAKNNNEEAVLP